MLVVHGGIGCSHDYLLPLADLVQFGYRVVFYDQVGCGNSERPRGTKHYTQRRAVDEVEGIRKALRLGRVHLFGHSYGGAVVLDAALKYPKSWRSLIVSSGFANFALFESEQARLFAALPEAVQETITRYEARGDLANPKYLAAIDVWWRKHGYRLRVFPYELYLNGERMREHSTRLPFDTIRHRLQGWDITEQLPEIDLPCLITAGQYDTITPKCLELMHRGIGGSKLVVFKGASHSHMWEKRDEFVEVVRGFLDHVSAR